MKKEPKTNSFLKPLTDELLIAWTEGFELEFPLDGSLNTYKVALVCIGCDIPAARKVGGFLGEMYSFHCLVLFVRDNSCLVIL